MKQDAARESRWERIYRVVRKIPRGRVAGYGQVARLAGLPNGARQVGYALHALRGTGRGIPWQRVVNARGEVSPRSEPEAERLQRALLESEGVRFGPAGRIDLARFGWQPRSGSRAGRGKAGIRSGAEGRDKARGRRGKGQGKAGGR